MQNQVEESQMTLDDLSSFNLFKIDDLISEHESIPEEDEEIEGMKALRSYPNVAFSRFNFNNSNKDNSQSPHLSPEQEGQLRPITDKRSSLMRFAQPIFTQVFIHLY